MPFNPGYQGLGWLDLAPNFALNGEPVWVDLALVKGLESVHGGFTLALHWGRAESRARVVIPGPWFGFNHEGCH